MEANPAIPGLLWYIKDVLFLVIPDNKYGERVPVQIGIKVMSFCHDYDWGGIAIGWGKLETGTPQHCISKRNTVKSLNVPKCVLKGIQGKICTMREVVILPFRTTIVKGIANLMMHSQCVNVVVKPVTGYSDYTAIARSYGVLRPGRGKIDVFFRNHNARQIILPKVDCCGRECSRKCHSGSVGTKANRMSQGRVRPPLQKGKVRSKRTFGQN